MNKSMRSVIMAILSSIVIFSGCIKDEALNMEVDVEKVIFGNEQAVKVIKIDQEKGKITIFLKQGEVDLTNVSLDFLLSEGATYKYLTENHTNLTLPIQIEVTSEDGKWTKTYSIVGVETEIPLTFNFEHWTKGEKYYSLSEIVSRETEDGEIFTDTLDIWASGNAGFAIVAGQNPPADAFPTRPSSDAKSGAFAACLETKSTGPLGAASGMPIAAGNLFIGEFDASNAMFKPLQATRFGFPFNRKPTVFKGWYKYKSGGKTNKTQQEDQCNIYAVLYKIDDQVKFLNGETIGDVNNKNIIGRANLVNGASTEGDTYHFFEIPFVYTENVDPVKLKRSEYGISMVFTSSKNGDKFDGAVGSKLFIDEVELECE